MRGNKPRIINYMQTHGGITSMDAFRDLGVTRLSAAIFDLRALGYDIVTLMIDGTNRYGDAVRYAKYVLRGEINE